MADLDRSLVIGKDALAARDPAIFAVFGADASLSVRAGGLCDVGKTGTPLAKSWARRQVGLEDRGEVGKGAIRGFVGVFHAREVLVYRVVLSNGRFDDGMGLVHRT